MAWDDVINGVVGNATKPFAAGEMRKKGYSEAVIQELLASSDIKTLQKMDALDDATLGYQKKDNPSFNAANEAIHNLGHTNVVFARHMADWCKNDEKGYTTFMNQFATELYANPKMADKVTALAKEGKVAELTAQAHSFARDPEAYMDKLNNVAAAAPAPKAPAVSGAQQSKPGAKPTVAPKAGTKPTSAKPTAAAPKEETLGTDGEWKADAETAENDEFTTDMANARFSKFLSSPRSDAAKKLAAEIKKHTGLEEKIRGQFKDHPELAKTFGTDGMLQNYMAALEKGDNQFMTALAGPQAELDPMAKAQAMFADLMTIMNDPNGSLFGGKGLTIGGKNFNPNDFTKFLGLDVVTNVAGAFGGLFSGQPKGAAFQLGDSEYGKTSVGKAMLAYSDDANKQRLVEASSRMYDRNYMFGTLDQKNANAYQIKDEKTGKMRNLNEQEIGQIASGRTIEITHDSNGPVVHLTGAEVVERARGGVVATAKQDTTLQQTVTPNPNLLPPEEREKALREITGPAQTFPIT